MRTAFLKVLTFCFGIGLCSCSTFYNRHYTKGVFYEGFAHRTRPAIRPENSEAATPQVKNTKDSLPVTALKDLPGEKTALQKNVQHTTTPEKTRSSAGPAFTKHNDVFSSPFLKKTWKPVQHGIRSNPHGDSILLEAALYILALVLALGIIALAIYFLPAILIPAAISSTFMTALLIAGIIVLVLFIFLIYLLFETLINLFKHRKTSEEEEF